MGTVRSIQEERDRVDGQRYRELQAQRLLVYLAQIGATYEDAQAGRVDLTPILGPDGKIDPGARVQS